MLLSHVLLFLCLLETIGVGGPSGRLLNVERVLFQTIGVGGPKGRLLNVERVLF